MNPLFLTACVLCCLVSALPSPAKSQEPPTRHVLFFSKSTGFEHSVIKTENGQPSFVEKVLRELGPAHHIEFTFSKDGGIFTPENIAKYDAFVFYTTGDLTKPGNDKNPPMTAEGKAALIEAVRNGKGFVGTHSASDTFNSPGDRYQSNLDALDPFLTMLGGEFIIHDAQQKAKMLCVDPQFPGAAGVKDGFELMEEWYSLKNFAPDLHVILVQQTQGMTGAAYQRPPYPVTWAHRFGKGRAFYTSMGHREDVWTNPVFQKILFGGIAWAVGDAEADVTPNLEKVCPEARTLPPKK